VLSKIDILKVGLEPSEKAVVDRLLSEARDRILLPSAEINSKEGRMKQEELRRKREVRKHDERVKRQDEMRSGKEEQKKNFVIKKHEPPENVKVALEKRATEDKGKLDKVASKEATWTRKVLDPNDPGKDITVMYHYSVPVKKVEERVEKVPHPWFPENKKKDR
jgi:hypothetical protein